MKPTIYTIAAVVAMLILMWTSAIEENAKEVPPTPVPRVEITRAMYDAVRPGMPTQEIIGILGEPNETIKSITPSGSRHQTLYWVRNKPIIQCIFINDQLTTKNLGGTLSEWR